MPIDPENSTRGPHEVSTTGDEETVIPARTPRAIIACSVFQPEMESLRKQSDDGVHIVYLEQNMHRTPHLLPETLQEEVDRAARWAEQIVLGYGLCSNGIVGVTAPEQGLVVPKAHDCVALFLGSIEEYNSISRCHPGTYYLTKGWIERDKDPLGMLEREYVPKLGRETAEWGAREELKHYTRFALIDTGAGDRELLRARARENARFFDKELVELRADPGYLERILYGPYDGQYFYLLTSGEQIQQRWFLR
jgi:hypothetical protein